MPKSTQPTVDEEPRTILRRIVESQAYRQLVAMNIRGHALKFLTDLESKTRVAEELHENLILFREVQALYRDLGWEDIEAAVHDRMDRIPFPSTRLEFGLCRRLFRVAQVCAMRCYVDCSNGAFAAIARSYLASGLSEDTREEEIFTEYCTESGHRPHAQEMFNRWLPVAVLSLGRPGSRNSSRAVELGLRTKSSGEMISDFLKELEPFAERCGLDFPNLAAQGLELPN